MLPLYRCLVLCSFVLALSTQCFAQRQSRRVIDSLLTNIQHPAHDSLKMQSLSVIVARYYYSQPDSAKRFANWAIAFADSVAPWSASEPDYSLGLAYNNLGACYSLQGNADSAMFFYDIAEEVFSKKELTKGLGMVYGNRSYDYMDWGWLEMAFDASTCPLAFTVDNTAKGASDKK